MRVFQNTTLVLPGGRIIVPIGLGSIVGEATKVDRAVKVEDKFHAVRQIEIDEVTGEPFDYADVRHGLKLGDGTFAEIPAETLEARRTAAKLDTIEIEEFIDADRLDASTVKSGYFIQPQRKFPMVAKALRLLYEGMRAEKKVAVVKFCARDRQARAIIQPHPDGSLRLIALHWSEQIREPDEEVLAHQAPELKLTTKERRAARELIRECSTSGKTFDAMRDDLIVSIEELIEGAEVAPMATPPGTQPVVGGDVMELLEQTLAGLSK